MKPTATQAAVFLLTEECGYSHDAVAATLKVSRQRVTKLAEIVMEKYAAARALAPEVPECQFRRAFLAASN